MENERRCESKTEWIWRPPMKKIICISLAFALLFTITACGNNGKEENTNMKLEFSTNTSASSDTEPEDIKESQTKAGEAQKEIQPTASIQESSAQEVTEMKMKIQVGDAIFTATLAKNSSVDVFKKLLADGPLTLHMSDYANMEKGADLGVTLPQNNEQMNTQAGDIILYQGRTFVIYYDTNSWSLTPIGKIDNVEAESLRAALGDGDINVTLSLE